MPGTGTYTQNEVDALVSDLSVRINTKTAISSSAATSLSVNTVALGNTNRIVDLENDSIELKADHAAISARILATQTESIYHTFQGLNAGETATGVVFLPYAAMTAFRVATYRTGGTNANVQVFNSTGEVMASKLVTVTAGHAIQTTLQNAGYTTGDYVQFLVTEITGSNVDVTVQLDLTI